MKVIVKGESPKAHGRHRCFSCSSLVEVERSDLRQSLGDRIDSILLRRDRYHWVCPLCFYRNNVDENMR